MIKINLLGNIKKLETGLEYLKEEMGVSIAPDGITIIVNHLPNQENLKISYDGKEGEIVYSTKNNFFRQLNLWLVNYKKYESFEKKEKAYFQKTGTMIDASRNAVPSVEGMKEFLRQMSKLGLNLAMLYTEDTFEVEEYPYFGYLRGKYTQEELSELDDYADALGIEMIPCIQTLGHLYQVLQHGTHKELQDTSDILLVGEPKTYEFIENIISTVTAPFRSNRIHIGMDEAFGLGTGRYKQLNGEKDTFEIMNEHVQTVVGITEKLGLESMMWSDMYIRIGSETEDYYDTNSVVPKNIVDEMPDVNMVYWDYYHEDKDVYKKSLQSHIDMKKKIIFAGGVWTWNGISPNYGKTIETSKAGLQASKELGIQEVFATMWGDDGGETSMFTALPGLQVFADLSYRETIDEALANDVSEHNTGLTFDEFLLLNKLDETPGVKENNLETAAVSKILLWQDPLLGRYDKGIEGQPLNAHYKKLATKLKPLAKKGKYKQLFNFYHQLSHVLSTRAEFGNIIKDAYDNNKNAKLNEMVSVAENLINDLDQLRLSHQNLWMKYNKPFGWEVMDVRYGGTIARMDSVVRRLSAYLNDELKQLPELEEEKLIDVTQNESMGRGEYTDIVSTSRLSGL